MLNTGWRPLDEGMIRANMESANTTFVIQTMFSSNINESGVGLSHPSSPRLQPYHPNCALYDFIVSGIIVGLSCFLGLIGNGVSFVILHNDPQKSVTTFLLTVLAIADICFLLPVVFLFVLPGFCNFEQNWCPASIHATLPFADKYGWAVASMAHTFTIYITMLVTWHRYLCVCLPHEAPKSSTMSVARKQVALVAVFAIIYNIPRFLEFNVNVRLEEVSRNGGITITTPTGLPLDPPTFLNLTTDGNDVLHSQTPRDPGSIRTKLVTWRTLTELGRNSWYQIVYKNICFYIFIYIIPLLSLVILTWKLAHTLKKRRRFRFRFSIRSRTPQGREDNITMVLIVVVIIFLICQTPTLFQRLLYTIFGDEGQKCNHFFFYFERFADYFAILNSCINFIIYVMFARRFRQVFWSSLRRRRGTTTIRLDDVERHSFSQEKVSHMLKQDTGETKTSDL